MSSLVQRMADSMAQSWQNQFENTDEESERRNLCADWLLQNRYGGCQAWLDTIEDPDFKDDMARRLRERQAARQGLQHVSHAAASVVDQVRSKMNGS